MFIVLGLIIGFLAAVPLGPINVYVVSQTLKRDFFHGMMGGLTASLLDALYCFLALVGISSITTALVKFNVIFRGPEMRHTDIGRRQLQLFTEKCADVAEVDQIIRMEARNMTLILAPRPEVAERATAEKRAAGEGQELHGEAEGKDAKGSGEAVQDHGDGASAPQEDREEPLALGEDAQAQAQPPPPG